ncbi:MAG: PAS domain S-box protein [Saprospiraceae bacterium]|nr:PAS domain S-box protein [Saprospiraceae bacterium]
MFETNTKGNLIFLNQQAADIVGVAKEDCLQSGFLIKHIHPDMQEQITTDWRQAIEHQQAYQNEIKWKRPDGRIAFTYLSISPLHSIDGDYKGQVGTLIDLTERKELARIVKLREIRFQSALNSANIGTWRVDLEKSCIYCDQNMLNIMEITDHDPETPISNELLMPLILEEDRKNMGTTLQKAQKHIPYESLEWRFNINGQLKWMRSHGSIYRDPLDDKYYLIGITQDITKEKQQIARIAQSEARIRSIFEGSNAVISFVNPEGIVQYANQQLFGAPNESLEQRSILEWFPEREKADFRKVLKATLLDRKTYTFESSVLDKNGKPSFYLHSLSPVVQDAEVLGVAIISNDISSIKSLKSNFRKASFSIENASEIIIWTDKAGRITYSNNALTKFLGYTQEEVFNMHLLDFDQMRSPADWKVFWSLIKKRINNTVLVKLIAKDGRLLDFEATYEYVFYEGEEYAIIFARDISERIRMEAVRQQKNQLAHINKELSQFAYVASHDLQEPLRTIVSFTQRIQQKYSDRLDEAGLTQMNFVVEASKRMNLLVKGILDYSRLGRNPKISEINTTALIKTILKDLYQRIEETKATVHIEHLPNIRGYETELRLLFQNLISNGLKFQQKDKPPVIYIRAYEQDSAWRFEIEDNGIGIAERHQKKIFEIFQRLHRRDTYEGTGIGLAQCKRIVDLHHGKIGVQSEVGKGSTFYFTISKNNNI